MLPEMHPDEVSPTAPIALVTMEIRHPVTDSLTESSRSEVKRLLVDQLPIERQAQDVSWGVAAPGSAPQPTAERFIRYVNRDNTVAASLRGQAIVVETTAYNSFETFLETVMRVVDARAQVSSIVGMERIGLRYVLEIRIPPSDDGRIAWGNWINASLLGPQAIAPVGMLLTEWQGAAVFRDPQPNKAVIVRYGPGVGQALDPNYHLRRATHVQPGPYFHIDIDSFWTPVGAIPEFNRDALIAILQDLYVPARSAFHEMITGRLKDGLLQQ
ncbi:TIGR04255 family protein [Mycobacterium sp. 852002-51163_SCH5372311]|uniref:TIGR04255 family protein n=1 Tax=Mycobacterium sp. 852002-51163_SCH5372311 TaxID=1834097 RepID=UPI00080059D1|nr:TIGR04255 family protein [Mycobacterium sp. 852002-51163_SCH5372311]OBF87839.1 TIGR04255 family protein [Mycobacterium sp. 852002-51163_SCH5372311]